MPRLLPPSRFRRVGKWVGAAVCLQAVIVWWIDPYSTYAYRNGLAYWLSVHNDGYVVAWLSPGWGEAQWPTSEHAERYFSLCWQVPTDWPVVSLSQTSVWIIIPYWLGLLLAVPPTAFWWYGARRSVKPGHCLTCGYDLRASKETCPECGTAVGPEASTL